MRHLSDGSRVQRPAAGGQQKPSPQHMRPHGLCSRHICRSAVPSRECAMMTARRREVTTLHAVESWGRPHTGRSNTSVFITTATRHEQVHHDAPSWACASRRCARCAGRTCALRSRQIVGCRAVRPSELSGSSAIRAPTSPEFSYTSFE